jgi:hypothetical protein
LGGGRVAQVVAGVAAMFSVGVLATGSIFSMDVLDQLWWALAALLVMRLVHRQMPRIWLLIGLVIAVALLTKLTVLVFCAALVLALAVTADRRQLRTRWPWLAGGVALVGLAPYVAWNAVNGWPTVQFWQNYRGVGTSRLDFVATQIGLINPIAVPLAGAGLVFYFHRSGRRYRVLGWTVVFTAVALVVLGTKPYFLAPVYPVLFSAGAVVFERVRLRPLLDRVRPAYVVVLALAGALLALDVMPILPPETVVRSFGPLQQVLADRLGWDGLTEKVEQVYAGLPPDQRAQACVIASNYGEAGALEQLAAPGRLPPVISGHNNYFIWGPDGCSGQVLITVGFPLEDLRRFDPGVELAATQTCAYCVSYEQNVPIAVIRLAPSPDLARRWPSLQHYD